MSGNWDDAQWDGDFWDTLGGGMTITISNSLGFTSEVPLKRVIKGIKDNLNFDTPISKKIKHFYNYNLTINQTPIVKKMNGQYFYVAASDTQDFASEIKPVWTEV